MLVNGCDGAGCERTGELKGSALVATVVDGNVYPLTPFTGVRNAGVEVRPTCESAL